MLTAEIRPFKGQMCKIKYGVKSSLTGTITDVSSDRLWIKEVIGEYSIPLEQITSVTSLTVATP